MKPFQIAGLPPDELTSFLTGTHSDPFRVLGPHRVGDDLESLTRDPYQYGPIMGEVDLHLFGEGQHWQIYEKFGAHLRTIGDAAGVYFAVWAPNAQRVSVVGDFNGWA